MLEEYFYADEEINSKLKEETIDFIEGLVESTYSTGDMRSFENCLQELCHLYDVSLPEQKMKIGNKEKDRLMNWYLGYQRATIEQGGTNV